MLYLVTKTPHMWAQKCFKTRGWLSSASRGLLNLSSQLALHCCCSLLPCVELADSRNERGFDQPSKRTHIIDHKWPLITTVQGLRDISQECSDCIMMSEYQM
jgi:hypothetical protein